MHLSALHHEGPLADLAATAKRMAITAASDVQEPSDAFQQAYSASASSLRAPDVPFPYEAATASAQLPTSSTPLTEQTTPNQASTAYPSDTDSASLLTTLKSYTAATQSASQAYQEYAKAWGGRVVHGQVELPPLSIYLE